MAVDLDARRGEERRTVAEIARGTRSTDFTFIILNRGKSLVYWLLNEETKSGCQGVSHFTVNQRVSSAASVDCDWDHPPIPMGPFPVHNS